MNNKDVVYKILSNLGMRDVVICSTINKLLKEMCELQYMRLMEKYENIIKYLTEKTKM